MNPNRRLQTGLTLIELLIATALTALLWTALQQVVMLALPSRQWLQSQQELQYQLDFALERISRVARSSRNTSLVTNGLGHSGEWFSPIYFCTTDRAELRETTRSDLGCTAGAVVATGITAFSVEDVSGTSGMDADLLRITLSIRDAQGASLSVQQDVRRMEGL